MDFCFRPLTGISFFYSSDDDLEMYLSGIAVSVPLRGLVSFTAIYISFIICAIFGCFRPLTGISFFYTNPKTREKIEFKATVSVPLRGLVSFTLIHKVVLWKL